jgi:uncharacterized protein YbaP (TraB family)
MAAVAAGFIVGLSSLAAQAAPALWKVSSPTAQVYLFGTLHALRPGTEWRTPAYDAAYARAETVWFEADLGTADPATVGLIVSRYGVDPERGLSEKLGPDDLRALQGQGNLERLEHLRPWAAALMLSMQPVTAGGAEVSRGADLTVTRQARAAGKQIRTFETLEDQARMFAGLSEGAEVRYLADVIHERQSPRKRLSLDPGASSLEAQWLAGDLAKLGPGLVGELARDNPGLYDALLARRNLAWADKIAGEMAGAHVELVNVGALHMVGPGGLPALMAARGFKVERIQ